MTIYVLRHGLAVERGTPGYDDDSKRPLTSEGERKLWRITEGMRVLKVSFDLILSSPYVRAEQTAQIVAQAFKARKRLEFTNSLVPGHRPEEFVAMVKRVRPAPENLLIVGHEPDLSGLISLLLTGKASLALTLKKGGLAKLEIPVLRPDRCASLAWLLTPGQMVKLGA